MDYFNDDDGFTELERASGIGSLIHGRDKGYLADEDLDAGRYARAPTYVSDARDLQISIRLKSAAKAVACLQSNRDIKLALVQRIHQESLDRAIVRYMAQEQLPAYYAEILKSKDCVVRLVTGVLYKVCKIKPDSFLDQQIDHLSSTLHANSSRLIAYDRVTTIQQFIHSSSDKYLGVGAARAIPVEPMRNALSAARLHLAIRDIFDHGPSYLAYIDNLNAAALQLEYEHPRPSTALYGKRTWTRWRVRHLRPLSYYFPEETRAVLQRMSSLDDTLQREGFLEEALQVYATA